MVLTLSREFKRNLGPSRLLSSKRPLLPLVGGSDRLLIMVEQRKR